ncbi:hypothetical protein AB1Y20_003108 [Prymnesium parvum]|uniref:PIPK domain-containing protein n=1 Tax=Prymnesium parvum TaxID=97485 RepID=A0AB34JB98_PRYPA
MATLNLEPPAAAPSSSSPEPRPTAEVIPASSTAAEACEEPPQTAAETPPAEGDAEVPPPAAATSSSSPEPLPTAEHLPACSPPSDDVHEELPQPADGASPDSQAVATPAAAGRMKHIMRKWIKEVALELTGTFKVPLSNKAGEEPKGLYAVLALELHAGLQPALEAAAASPASVGRRQAWWKSPRRAGSSVSRLDAKAAEVEALEPQLFRRIRAAFNVDEVQFQASICLQCGRAKSNMTVIGGSEAAGKSGAFFFLSPDQFYLFKSAKPKEVALLRRILPDYAAHMESCHGSILPRYLALFHLRGTKDLVFLCMTNAFAGTRTVDRRFDLKGSMHNRKASARERNKAAPVYKDLDWLAEGRVFPCSKAFLSRLEEDVAFLAQVKLIDYSLLVGVAKVEGDLGPAERTPGLVCLHSNDACLYIALVDILTRYNWKKAVEHHFTGTLFCCRDVSCQPPRWYAHRFINFINKISLESPSSKVQSAKTDTQRYEQAAV